jgi:chromate transporter
MRDGAWRIMDDVLVSYAEIAVTFARIASSAFGGGTLALARRELVINRRWLTDDGFIEVLSLAQVVPGPNLTNLAVLVGARLRGPAGAALAFAAMMAPAYLLVMAIAAAVVAGARFPWLTAALRGCAAGAVGLSLANAVELTLRFRRDLLVLAIVALSALAVGVLHLSLPVVLLILVPPSYVVLRGRTR